MMEKLITSDMLIQFVSNPGVRWKEFQIRGGQAVEIDVQAGGVAVPLWILFFKKDKDAGRKVSAILKDLESNEAPKSDLAKLILASVDRSKRITGKAFHVKVGLRRRSFGAIIANDFDLAEDVTAFDLVYAFLMTSQGSAEPKDAVLKHFDELVASRLQHHTDMPKPMEAAAW